MGAKKMTTIRGAISIREQLQQDSDELLLDALAETASKAKERIIKDKDFSIENIIPLLLLSQYNHIAHLDADVNAINQELKNLEQKIEQKMDEQSKKMDVRFEKIDERFEKLADKLDERFEKIDERFEKLADKLDERFEKIDERFVETYKSISDIHNQISNQTKWILGMGVGIVTILGGLITFLKLDVQVF
jgi:predicted  nucleic acid-binding Zn-ribbon protein